MKSGLYVKSLLLIIAVFLGIIALRPFLKTDLATATEWIEYRAIPVTTDKVNYQELLDINKRLDHYEKDGWELVSHCHNVLIFKK